MGAAPMNEASQVSGIWQQETSIHEARQMLNDAEYGVLSGQGAPALDGFLCPFRFLALNRPLVEVASESDAV
jgi:hypothetical protein